MIEEAVREFLKIPHGSLTCHLTSRCEIERRGLYKTYGQTNNVDGADLR